MCREESRNVWSKLMSDSQFVANDSSSLLEISLQVFKGLRCRQTLVILGLVIHAGTCGGFKTR